MPERYCACLSTQQAQMSPHPHASLHVTRNARAHPCLVCRLQGISDADVGTLQGVLDDAVQENLGMAMIYTLISLAQEWITVCVWAAMGILVERQQCGTGW